MTSVETTSAVVADKPRRTATGVKTSIIVPVLNEGPRLRGFLKMLRERAPMAEIIVVCCGDLPGIVEAAADLADSIVKSRRGRAVQMNAGAAAANGNIFWFVHADCEVPRGCLDEIERVLQDSSVAGGCFRIRFPRHELIYRVSDTWGNLAVELFGRCYGDHGIFCRRDAFAISGGYPELPLLEDAEFYRRLRGHGRTGQLSSEIITSPRRYEEIGPYRLTAVYLLISALYVLRVPISLLVRIYDRWCRRSNEPPH